MSDTGVMIAMSACIGCGNIFAYDPDRVPSIAVKLGTGRAFKRPAEACPKPGCPSCTREPVCPACAKAANPERRRLGFEPVYEGDTAEDLTRGTPRPV